MRALMTQEDIKSIQMCLITCQGCNEGDCLHCPMRVTPGRLLHLAESYKAVMESVDMISKAYKEEV